MTKLHWYELIHRGISIGTHPKNGHMLNAFGHKNRNGLEFGAVGYDRELTEKELYEYELESIEQHNDTNTPQTI